LGRTRTPRRGKKQGEGKETNRKEKSRGGSKNWVWSGKVAVKKGGVVQEEDTTKERVGKNRTDKRKRRGEPESVKPKKWVIAKGGSQGKGTLERKLGKHKKKEHWKGGKRGGKSGWGG